MIDENLFERRLTAIEMKLEEIGRRSTRPATKNWLDAVIGIAGDDLESFDEMVRLGREFREADRPKDDDVAP